MRGTDSTTGKALDGLAHLRQSIRDVLTTPLGSRVMRRDYGSRLFDLVDAPLNAVTKAEIFAAAAESLMRWEPRLMIQQVAATSTAEGSIQIDVSGIYIPTGEPVFLDGLDLGTTANTGSGSALITTRSDYVNPYLEAYLSPSGASYFSL